MKRSNRLVIFVGVLLAILAFVGVVIVLNQGPSGPTTQTSKVNVLVANNDIHIGDPVTPDKVHVIQVDPGAVKGTALGDPSLTGGKPALVDLPKDTQISREDLYGGSSNISQLLKPGEKAVAFQVERVTGMDFLITAGDHIDIVLSQKITVLQPTADTVNLPPARQRFETLPGLDSARTVKTILQNKRVLYVSQTRIQPQQAASASATPAPAGGSAAAPAQIENVIIVFAGTDQDAEVIKFAQNDLSELGSLTAVIRGTQDTATEKTTGITIDRLVSQYGLALPTIVKRNPGQ